MECAQCAAEFSPGLAWCPRCGTVPSRATIRIPDLEPSSRDGWIPNPEERLRIARIVAEDLDEASRVSSLRSRWGMEIPLD